MDDNSLSNQNNNSEDIKQSSDMPGDALMRDSLEEMHNSLREEIKGEPDSDAQAAPDSQQPDYNPFGEAMLGSDSDAKANDPLSVLNSISGNNTGGISAFGGDMSFEEFEASMKAAESEKKSTPQDSERGLDELTSILGSDNSGGLFPDVGGDIGRASVDLKALGGAIPEIGGAAKESGTAISVSPAAPESMEKPRDGGALQNGFIVPPDDTMRELSIDLPEPGQEKNSAVAQPGFAAGKIPDGVPADIVIPAVNAPQRRKSPAVPPPPPAKPKPKPVLSSDVSKTVFSENFREKKEDKSSGVSSSETAISGYIKAIQDKEKENSELKGKLEEALNHGESLSKELKKEKEEREENVRKAGLRHQEELARLEDEIIKFKQEMIRSQLSGHKEGEAGDSTAPAVTGEQRDNFEKQLQDFEKIKSDFDEKRKDFIRQLSEKDSELSELGKKNDAADEMLSAADKKIGELEKQLRTSGENLKEVEGRERKMAALLEEEKKKKDDENSTLSGELEKLKGAAESDGARIKDLEAKLVDMNLGRQELEKELFSARSEKELLLLDLTKAREKNSSLEERHKEELEKKEEELRETLEKQKKYFDGKLNEKDKALYLAKAEKDTIALRKDREKETELAQLKNAFIARMEEKETAARIAVDEKNRVLAEMVNVQSVLAETSGNLTTAIKEREQLRADKKKVAAVISEQIEKMKLMRREVEALTYSNNEGLITLKRINCTKMIKLLGQIKVLLEEKLERLRDNYDVAAPDERASVKRMMRDEYEKLKEVYAAMKTLDEERVNLLERLASLEKEKPEEADL